MQIIAKTFYSNSLKSRLNELIWKLKSLQKTEQDFNWLQLIKVLNFVYVETNLKTKTTNISTFEAFINPFNDNCLTLELTDNKIQLFFAKLLFVLFKTSHNIYLI